MIFFVPITYVPTDNGLEFSNKLIKIAWKSEIVPIQNTVNTIAKHWNGIETYFHYCISNRFSERVNLKIREIKRIAKMYANMGNFILIINFHLEQLDHKLLA